LKIFANVTKQLNTDHHMLKVACLLTKLNAKPWVVKLPAPMKPSQITDRLKTDGTVQFDQ